MGIAFQPNAFQDNYPGGPLGFQTFDRIISIASDGGTLVRPWLLLRLGPLMLNYARSAAIVFECHIFDPSVSPPMLTSPTNVYINLIKPDGTNQLTLQAMNELSTGFYRYIWQSASNSALGVYGFNIKATNGVYTAQTITEGAFRLMEI